jgi:non-ribosomal peptide synthase protein (TIGR01720 family)
LRLILVAHHLVVDAVSWRILLPDLIAGYAQVTAGKPAEIPPVGTSASAWAGALAKLAEQPQVVADAEFWRHQAGAALPLHRPPRGALERNVRHGERILPEPATRLLLREVPRAYHTTIEDVLLTALATAVARLTGQREVTVMREGHGREQHLVHGVDLSRTVGWLTALAPARLCLPDDDALPAALTAIKEQLRAVPHEGLSYGMLRHLADNPVMPRSTPLVSFNYLGQLHESTRPGGDPALLLSPAPEPAAAAHHPENRRPNLLDITGITTGGRLRLTFSYDNTAGDRETVEALADETLRVVHELIDHCTRVDTGRYTPSDFPESGLDQRQLDSLVAELTDLR